ncbi:hypothetical protein EKK58_05410 [Candidatus Dependentiae bacterium]|nr:MAG: hypothetical protein EKK58_05410 [Candidatus Dependentiae bacterium]
MSRLTCRAMFSAMVPQLQKLALRAIEKGFDRTTACVMLMDVEDPTWSQQAEKYQPDGPKQWAELKARGGTPLLWGWGKKSEFLDLLGPHRGYASVVRDIQKDPGEGIFHVLVFGEGGVLLLPLVHPDPMPSQPT